MTRSLCTMLVALAAVTATASTAEAQDPAPLQPGVEAPDFNLPGAVRHGILAEPVSLADYAGKTVVLAFFFRARTRG